MVAGTKVTVTLTVYQQTSIGERILWRTVRMIS